MVRIVLKGIHTTGKTLADGTRRTYYYAWKNGPRLHSKPGSNEFVQEFNNAINSRQGGMPGTLGFVIGRYKAGPLLEKKPSTRKDYERSLKEISEKFNSMPLPKSEEDYLLARRTFNTWRDALPLTPRAADKRWTMLSTLCTFGVKIGELTKNPCLYGGNTWSGTRRECVWNDYQIQLVRKHMSDEMILVFDLALETGQRLNDILQLKWSQFDGERLQLAQNKRLKKVSILLSKDLAARLRRIDKAAVTICTNTKGQPWTLSGYSSAFGKKNRSIGNSGVTFHDLRGTAVINAAVDGADPYELASKYGWSLKQVDAILERHYLAPSQQKADAIILRAEAKNGTKLQTVSKLFDDEG